MVRQEVSLPDFSKITVFEKVGLIIKQGATQKVEIETGEFLLEEVSATVEGDRLILRNENGCNLFRKYEMTKVYVTSPNITEIRSSTGLAIKSDGILTYPFLELFSESFLDPGAGTTDGEFDLELASQSVSVVVNGIAYFKLRGTSENLSLIVAAGDSRIKAENLLAQNINLNHRGSNDMFINPIQSVSGVIRGNGDVISSNRPATVEVEELYKGKLIFR
ncbi:MAG: head GIN domain-containing protein [Aurantibacter sp.]